MQGGEVAFARSRGRALVIAFLFFALLYMPLVFADRVKWSADFQNTDITGGIAVDGNYIYLASLDSVSQLQIVDGKGRWSVHIKGGTLLKPIKSGGIVLALSKEGVLYEVSDSTRTIIKTYNLSGEVLNDPLVISTNIYIPTSKGVNAFSTQTGSAIWAPKSTCSVQSTPVIIGDKLMYACDNGNIEMISRTTGELVDQARYSYVFWKSSPLVLGDSVYFGSFDGKVLSISKKGPKGVRWVRETPDGTPVYADIVADGTNAIITTAGGKVCALQPTGDYAWCVDTSSGVGAAPIVTDGGIYAIADNGMMYSITHDGKVNWAYDTGLPVKADMVKKGSMIYIAAKNGTVAAISTSSCNILFPSDKGDISGVDILDVEVDAYADTAIKNVQVKAGDSGWTDTEKSGNEYVAKMPASSIPIGESEISCRVISEDGEELQPYTVISVVKKPAGKKMVVEAPTGVGYGSSFDVRIKDESGAPLDRVTVIFGNLKYNNINGTIRITPSAKGLYRLEVRRAGYVPFRGEVNVGDDYTIIAVMAGLVIMLLAVFYIFYKKWMEE